MLAFKAELRHSKAAQQSAVEREHVQSCPPPHTAPAASMTGHTQPFLPCLSREPILMRFAAAYNNAITRDSLTSH